MNRVIFILAVTAALGFGQTVGSFPSVVGTGGGSGGQNASATSVPAVTSLAIDITSLNASSVDKVLVQCWSGAAAPFSPVTITSLNPASTTSITANFGSIANVTCRANATGVGATGAAGTPGATGATGPAGANGTNGTNGAISQLQDEGSNLTVRPTINFTGAGVSCTDDAGNTRTNCAVSGGGGGSPDIQVGGSLIGTQPAINFIAGTGGVIAGVDDAGNSRVNVTINPDSAIYLSRATDQVSTDILCRSTTGNDTYTCSLTPALTSYGDGTTSAARVILNANFTNVGPATLEVNGLGAKSILNRAGAALANGDITANVPITLVYDGTQFIVQGDGGGGGGSGDVVGPASAVDSAVALFDTTTGKLLKGTASAGTVGQVLASNGAGVSPSFQDAASVGFMGFADSDYYIDNFMGATSATNAAPFWAAAGSGFASWPSTSTQGRPEVQINSGGTSNNLEVIDMTRGEGRLLWKVGTGGAWTGWYQQLIVRTGSSVADTNIAVGWSVARPTTSFRQANTLSVRFNSSNPACSSGTTSGTTWVLETYTTSGTVSTCSDTGVTVSADSNYRIEMYSTTLGTVLARVKTNGGAWSSPVTVSSNVPSTDVTPFFGIQTLTGSAKNLYARRFAFRGDGASQ